MKKTIILGLLAVAFLSACKSGNQTQENTGTEPQAANTQVSPEEAGSDTLKPGVDYQIEIETPYGVMKVWLYDETPRHRDNFIKHARQGYYDGTLFHRVIQGFMIQGGDPDSRNASPGATLGNGGPGYTIPAEFVPAFLHKKGALAAARTGDQINPKKESSGSQFYIVQGRTYTNDELTSISQSKRYSYTFDEMRVYRTLGGTPDLDRNYTVFGEVVSGIGIIDKIAAVETGQSDRPKVDVAMKVRYIEPTPESR